MTKNNSPCRNSILNLNTENFKIAYNESYPDKIYKYFSEDRHRQNFLNGNIWFCGPSKNRLGTQTTSCDKYEYRNIVSTILFEYSLSFSMEVLDNARPNIVIDDVKSFKSELGLAISSNRGHQVFWLDKKQIAEVQKENLVLYAYDNASELNKTVSLNINSLGSRLVNYEDKINESHGNVSTQRNIQNAYAGNKEFKDEVEYRFHINTTDFCEPNGGRSLLYIVQYLKISCPILRKYCKPI